VAQPASMTKAKSLREGRVFTTRLRLIWAIRSGFKGEFLEDLG
jgi:hypothetical protein